MSTLTLACTGGTFLSYKDRHGNYSSLTELPTSCYLLGCVETGDGGYTEERKRHLGEAGFDYGGAMLQFEGNALLSYKRIKSVKLHYTIKVTNYLPHTFENYLNGYSGNNIFFGEYYGAYKGTEDISQINFYSIDNPVQYSSFYNDLTNIIPNNVSSYQRTVDITQAYKSNFAGAQSRLIFSVGLGYRLPEGWPLSANALYVARYTNSSGLQREATINKSTAYLEVDYEDIAQPAPTPIYPTNVSIMESDSINFSWQFNSSTAAGQQSATIQYKKTTDADWTTVTSSGSGKNYTLNTQLPQGSYAWRVAVTNTISQTSSYCDTQYFEIIGKPASPVINAPANKALTEITWQATGQEAVELMFYDEEGNLIDHVTEATTVASYKPQRFLYGNYSIKIRIKNNADLWSDFAQYGFTISGSTPSAGTLIVIPLETSVRLEWTAPEGVNSVIVRREKGVETVLSNTMGGNTYEDKTVKSGVLYEYLLRTWTNGYTDTPSIQATCKYTGAIISKDNEELHLEVSDDTFLLHAGTKERSHALDDFVGRDNPLLELGSAKRNKINKRFYVTPENLEKFFELTQDLKVFYRDDHNNAFMAAITQQSYENFNNSGYILQFELTRLAEEEVIFNV